MAQPSFLHLPLSVVIAGHSVPMTYFTFHSVPFFFSSRPFLCLSCMIFLWLALLNLELRFFQLPFERFYFRASYRLSFFRPPLFPFSSLLLSRHFSFFSSTFDSVGWFYLSSVDLAFVQRHLRCHPFMHGLTVCIKFPHWFGALVAALSGVRLGWRMQIATEIAYYIRHGVGDCDPARQLCRQTLAVDKTRYWVEITRTRRETASFTEPRH